MANVSCYAPNGDHGGNAIPCGFADNNQCCGLGWDCLANGLCREHGTTSYSQAGCTDADYNNCLSFCNAASFGGFTEVSSCGINSWCCGGIQGQESSDADCCTVKSLTTSLQPFPYSIIEADQVGKASATPATSSAGSTTKSGAKTISAPGSSRTSSTATVGAIPQSTSSGGSTTPSSASSSSNSGLSTGAKLGIGVAIPVVVLLLAVLGFLVYKSRKQGRYLRDLQEKDGAGYDRAVEAPTSQMSAQGYVSEAYGSERYEMPMQESRRYEMDEQGGDGRLEIGETHGLRHELSSELRRAQ